MAFDSLPVQSQEKMGPAAQAYAAEILERSRQVARSSRVALDIAYGEDYWQRLDLYLPEATGLRDLPVLVFLHGGGWSNGYKEWMGYMAPSFTDLPAIFVSVSYRLLPQVRFPAPLEDSVAALAWVHGNIARYGGSPERLFIGGHSAGGHLASLAALRRDLLAAAGVPLAALRACFPVSATFKFELGDLEKRGKDLLARPEDAAQASPISHVAGNAVPFYIAWGSRDLDHVMTTGMPMVEALKREKCRVEHQVFEGFDHFQISIDGGRRESPWVKTVRAWMAA
ncbi:MAG: alpha/beta hydrolase [Proteobacteria bacterium]|nr:alpha/beta hydrolase [Pseudomonadota bacterium]MBI3495828.1 alpha/beta hydrolase [Pseudomonadota bacterium]